MVVGTVCIGAFIGQVDASIIQLAMPSLEDAFDAPLHAVSWAAIGYVLAFASTLPLFARLAEIGGRKALYLTGFVLFALFSALCGLATSLPTLIVFRLLQGAGGATLGANSLVILVTAAGPARRGKAIGIMAAAQAVGLSLGPALGGVLLSAFGWRSIFWVTVPFAILGAALGWLIVPRTTALAKDRRFDIGGAILVVPALAAAMLTITEAQAWGLSAPLLVSAAVAASLLGAFVWRENRAPAPLIDLKLFRAANFSAGAVGVLVSYAMLYGMFFAISFAFVRGYHEPFFAAGLRLTVVPVALALVAPFGGAASDKQERLPNRNPFPYCMHSPFPRFRLRTRGSPNRRLDGKAVRKSVIERCRWVSVPQPRCLVRCKTSLTPIFKMTSGWALIQGPVAAASRSTASSTFLVSPSSRGLTHTSTASNVRSCLRTSSATSSA